MKNLYALFLFSFIVVNLLRSQVTFDFSKMEDIGSKEIKRKIQPVKNGEIVLIQIKNINTFLYKVEIIGKQIELQTPIPSELQNLFRLSAEELEPNASNAEEGAEKSSSALKDMKNLESNPNTSASLKNKLKELIKGCEKYLDKLNAVVEGVADMKYARMQLITYAKENLTFNEITQKIATIKLPNEATLKRTYKDFETLYYGVESLYERAESSAVGLEKDTVHDALEKIEAGFAKIDEEKLLSIIEDVLTLKLGLENSKNFQVNSPPIYMEGDFVSYEVSITPTRTNNLSAYKNPIKWEVNIPAKGGWKADFSVGPTLSFGANSRDNRYFLQKTASDTLVVLQQRDNDNAINPSLAAMMHFYPRTGKYAAYGFNFGVGAGFQSVADVNLSVFLGGSIILGRERKIMLSGGVSYLKVDRLKSPEFEVGATYNLENMNISNVVEKTFKPSSFLSISYNLSNKVEIN